MPENFSAIKFTAIVQDVDLLGEITDERNFPPVVNGKINYLNFDRNKFTTTWANIEQYIIDTDTRIKIKPLICAEDIIEEIEHKFSEFQVHFEKIIHKYTKYILNITINDSLGNKLASEKQFLFATDDEKEFNETKDYVETHLDTLFSENKSLIHILLPLKVKNK